VERTGLIFWVMVQGSDKGRWSGMVWLEALKKVTEWTQLSAALVLLCAVSSPCPGASSAVQGLPSGRLPIPAVCLRLLLSGVCACVVVEECGWIEGWVLRSW
jgi:hypothetical protein